MAYHQTSSGHSRRQVSGPRDGSGNGRRVTPASSLASRFQQVQQSRRTANNASPNSGGGRMALGRSPRSSHPASPAGRGGRGSKGRQSGGVTRRPPTGSGPAPTRRAFRTASRMMDVDSGHGSPTRGAGRGRGRGRGRQGGRGGARSGRPASSSGGRRGAPNKDRLDMDLDNYMMGDTKTGKSILDHDLDNYMLSNPSAGV